jgi:hypothetical protein
MEMNEENEKQYRNQWNLMEIGNRGDESCLPFCKAGGV